MKMKGVTFKLLMVILVAAMIMYNASYMAWLDAPGVPCVTKPQTSMAKEQGMILPTQEEGTDTTASCDELMLAIMKNQEDTVTATAATVNRLRRRLMMYHHDCFQQHQDFFEDFFLRRTSSLKQRHLILHIPKTAGTGLCQLAQETPGLTYGNTSYENCQIQPYFCPLWCCCTHRPSLATCEDLKYGPDVIMNENYWDHLGFYSNEEEENCGAQRLVSMTLRHPVDRAISNVLHFMDIEGEDFAEKSLRMWQLNLIQSNYMTWSLVAGLHYSRRTPNTTTIIAHVDTAGDENSTVPVYLFKPQWQHLDVAKMTMASMDFLLEFSRDGQCDATILHYMGIGENNATLPHARVRPNNSTNYGKKQLRRESYELLNQLDMELYQYAVKMMKVDCQFFAGVVEKEKQGGK